MRPATILAGLALASLATGTSEAQPNFYATPPPAAAHSMPGTIGGSLLAGPTWDDGRNGPALKAAIEASAPPLFNTVFSAGVVGRWWLTAQGTAQGEPALDEMEAYPSRSRAIGNLQVSLTYLGEIEMDPVSRLRGGDREWSGAVARTWKLSEASR